LVGLLTEHAAGFLPANVPVVAEALGSSHQRITTDSIEELVLELYGISKPPLTMKIAILEIAAGNAAVDLAFSKESYAHFDGENFVESQKFVLNHESFASVMWQGDVYAVH
jgi:hypothetical protein